jgi:hypothetical protein
LPLLVVMTIALGALLVWTADDARLAGDLRRQVQQQAQTAGVLFLDDRLVVPGSGERQVPVLVDGRPADGRIVVDGDLATLHVRAADGTFRAPVRQD